MFKINIAKKILISIRSSVKVIVATVFAIGLICLALGIVYKPAYKIWIDDVFLGYVTSKSSFQNKVNEYIKGESQDKDNVAFVQIDSLPRYKLCLVKRTVELNDGKILEEITSEGKMYYKYFTVSDRDDRQYYLKDYESAEAVIEKLKEKNSSNKDKLKINQKYEVDEQDVSEVDDVVERLYEKVKYTGTSNRVKASGTNSKSKGSNTSGKKVDIGISLIRPSSGIISSTFGDPTRRRFHQGLDIASNACPPIHAAASGTVTFAGYSGGYGNKVVVSHGNGVETVYAHCSKIYVSAGKKVSQGQEIAKMGNTGNSTGIHLHFEVRVNGVAQNPQFYI